MRLIELALLAAGNWQTKKSEIVREARALLGDVGSDLGKDREYLVAIDGLERSGYMRWDGPGAYSTTQRGNDYLREVALPVMDKFTQTIRYNLRRPYAA